MSSAGTRLRRERPSERRVSGSAASLEGRSSLAYLLHALNQPLTGLQCSLELAVAAARRPEEYVKMIRDGIELTNRMRALVDALQEVIAIRASRISGARDFELRDLLAEVVDELRPVAESRRLQLAIACEPGLRVAYDRNFFRGFTFRLIETLLGQARADGEIEIKAQQHRDETQFAVAWDETRSQQDSGLSHAELSLLLVEAACERLGGRFERGYLSRRSTLTMTFRAAPGRSANRPKEDAK